MSQEPQSREYINGMLAALNIAMIYARDTERRMTEEDIQGEIETVMNIPVKSEPKKSESAIHNLELKERNEALSEFNQKVEKANMLTKQLTEAILQLPVFTILPPKPEPIKFGMDKSDHEKLLNSGTSSELPIVE